MNHQGDHKTLSNAVLVDTIVDRRVVPKIDVLLGSITNAVAMFFPRHCLKHDPPRVAITHENREFSQKVVDKTICPFGGDR
jgi:hypothetical protein